MVFPVVGGDGKPTGGYEIDNSMRFNRGDAACLRKTFSGSPTSTKICTISFWTKLADPSNTDAKAIFSAIKSGVNEDVIKFMGVNNGILNGIEINFNNTGDGSMMISSGNSTLIKLRDPSAWYHIVIAIDSSQGTASNRVKVYINGTQFDTEARVEGGSVADDVALSQNYELGFLTASAHSIGENVESAGNEPYDGYLADFHFVDGQQLAPTTFAETDDNGVWIPKDCKDDLTYGNYGFFLEFKQTGTSANSSGMGADTSGNDNHFTPTNLQSDGRHITTDTPTNNFCTMNPLTASSRATFSNGNTKLTLNLQNSVPYGQVEFGNFFVNKGKWYYEVFVVENGAGGQVVFGWNEKYEDGGYFNGHNNLGSSGNVYYGDDGHIRDGSVGETTAPDTYADSDIIGIALDLDNHKFYAHKNGTYQSNGSGTGNPSNGTNGYTVTSAYNDYWTPWISKDSDNASHNPTANFNFGNGLNVPSSGNSDANGYGNFEYAVPTGYYSLCTKNLAEYG